MSNHYSDLIPVSQGPKVIEGRKAGRQEGWPTAKSKAGPGCAKLGLAGRNATPTGGPYPIWRLTDGRIKCCVVFDVVPEGDAISFLTPQTRLLSFSTSSGPIDEFGGSFCSSHSGLQSVPQKFIHFFRPHLYWCQEGVNSDIEGATWPCR
ncbi:hypothetical protein B0H13DRAFT_1871716 [Mycena leptocephala]|nr:hypothetical protein B0H13DRAFT_1871716 [Mycena leptocephala]